MGRSLVGTAVAALLATGCVATEAAEADGTARDESAMGCIEGDCARGGAEGGEGPGVPGGGIDVVVVHGESSVFREEARRWAREQAGARPEVEPGPRSVGPGGGGGGKVEYQSLFCPVPGAPCKAACDAISAPCVGAKLDKGEFGALVSCKNGIPTFSCMWKFPSGRSCGQVLGRPFGYALTDLLCFD